jgi:hypothetical protein
MSAANDVTGGGVGLVLEGRTPTRLALARKCAAELGTLPTLRGGGIKGYAALPNPASRCFSRGSTSCFKRCSERCQACGLCL